MRTPLVLLLLASLALTALSAEAPKRARRTKPAVDCERALATFNGCLERAEGPAAAAKRRLAAEEQCFRDAGCQAAESEEPEPSPRPKEPCPQQALAKSGLGAALDDCAKGAGLRSSDILLKTVRAGKAKGRRVPGVKRGGRRSPAPKPADREKRATGAAKPRRKAVRKAKLVERCGSEVAPAGLARCLRQARRPKPRGSARPKSPAACKRALPRPCAAQLRRKVCDCFRPSFRSRKAAFLEALRECRPDAAETDADGFVGSVCGRGAPRGRAKGTRRRGGNGGS